MSHPVFLNASSFPRMPNGEAGEWRSFWSDGREELEAGNGIPLLWWCLFGRSDLHRARLIDDADIGTEDRDELHDAIGDEALTYPYLVTSREKALQCLEKRRAPVLAALGPEYALVYDAFADSIEQRFGPFILVRTSGLPDPADAEPWLSEVAAEMDGIDAGASPGPQFTGMADEIRRAQPSDAIWMLGGSGETDVWPLPELISAFPRTEAAQREREQIGRAASPSGAIPKPSRGRSRLKESLVEWLAGIIVGGSALGAYVWTSSALAALLAFVTSAAIMVWLIIRLRR